MNWLDTQTKEILQKEHEPKLFPPKVAEFALVLIRKGQNHARMVRAVSKINECSERDAAALLNRSTPITINPDLTEEEALMGQFELICCDAISAFVRSEVLERNQGAYLQSVFDAVSHSAEFRPTTVNVAEVPQTEAGEKFIDQFFGGRVAPQVFPLALEVPFKKARIMKHWAGRIGAEIQIFL
jgi:hypothetical protein